MKCLQIIGILLFAGSALSSPQSETRRDFSRESAQKSPTPDLKLKTLFSTASETPSDLSRKSARMLPTQEATSSPLRKTEPNPYLDLSPLDKVARSLDPVMFPRGKATPSRDPVLRPRGKETTHKLGRRAALIRPTVEEDTSGRVPSAVSAAGGTGRVCLGILHYRTSAFVSAAFQAADTLWSVLGTPAGEGFKVVWVLVPIVDGTAYTEAEWDDYQNFYRRVAGAYASDYPCIHLVEVEVGPELGGAIGPSRILGTAVECAACSADWNVALVRSGLDAGLTYAVILHELGHLFCAPHLDDGDFGVMSPYAGSRVISEQSEALMRGGMRAKFDAGSCPDRDWEVAAGGAAAFPRNNAAPSHDCGVHHSHSHAYDEYDTAVGILIFSIFAVVAAGLIYWTCEDV